MDNTKFIINADDFGRSPEINKAICMSIDEGMVTDTSMMATLEDGFNDAIRPSVLSKLSGSVGVHLCLTLGKPLTDSVSKDPAFCDEKGFFLPELSRNIDWTAQRKKNIYNEFDAQIKKIKSTGLLVTHADSHQHIHWRLELLRIVVKCCKNNGIKYVRITNTLKPNIKSRLISKGINFYIKASRLATSSFFGDYKQVGKILPPSGKYSVVEIMCHPMFDSGDRLIDKMRIFKPEQCELLSDHLAPFLLYKNSFVKYK